MTDSREARNYRITYEIFIFSRKKLCIRVESNRLGEISRKNQLKKEKPIERSCPETVNKFKVLLKI